MSDVVIGAVRVMVAGLVSIPLGGVWYGWLFWKSGVNEIHRGELGADERKETIHKKDHDVVEGRTVGEVVTRAFATGIFIAFMLQMLLRILRVSEIGPAMLFILALWGMYVCVEGLKKLVATARASRSSHGVSKPSDWGVFRDGLYLMVLLCMQTLILIA